MFIEQIISYFRLMEGMEPSSVVFLFALPEEDPKVFIYEVTAGDTVSSFVVEILPQGLMTRKVKDELELEAIRKMSPALEN